MDQETKGVQGQVKREHYHVIFGRRVLVFLIFISVGGEKVGLVFSVLAVISRSYFCVSVS